ncbi:AAA family ATPase [Vibrio vulnificus]|uniref:ATP-binding protein n=1 Tax=Vibrio vulnificus TaxID=672 RepID=UPI0028CFD540|nr:AAA family ATPase [Vibrio vulnificus]
MKVFYQGTGTWNNSTPGGLASEPNLLSLSGNNWDDYGTKTTLNASLYFDGERLDFDFDIKILIQGSDYTAATLSEMKAEGWDGFFPIPSCNYISLPSEIEFYSIVMSKLGIDEATKLIELLNDAGFQKNITRDESFSELLRSPEFAHSLLRESGAMKAFVDGWRIFDESLDEVEIYDFDLNVLSRDNKSIPIPFRFNSHLLPYDINVLIGPNGVGKSHAIKSLTEYWLKTESGDPELLESLGHEPFSKYPNFSNLILVSYSPFEDFKLDLENDEKLNNKNAYKYFGFRRNDEEYRREVVDRDLPSINSAESVIKALYDDEKLGFITGWVNKLELMLETLNHGFKVDVVALKVTDPSNLEQYSLDVKEIDGVSYLPLFPDIAKTIEKTQLQDACDLKNGVTFIYKDSLCLLSSGQKLFSYIVINVLGELRKNSLVVVDEPELFLHPTLEIAFVSLLKRVLEPFKSKAVLATHSLSIVREVPSQCVHIFKNGDFGLDIVPPPFETFGGSVQRISAYVFGDKSVTKPFDKWIESLVESEPNADKLIAALGDEVNEHLIMKIHRLARGYNGR